MRNDCDVKRVQRVCACVCVGRENNTTTVVVAKEEYCSKQQQREHSAHTQTQTRNGHPSRRRRLVLMEAHYSSTLPESSTPAAARFDQIQEPFLVPVSYPCSFSIHSRHCEPMRLDWLAVVRYEVFCYALVALLYYSSSPHEATTMTPRLVYSCCCTAVRGAASRVAASHQTVSLASIGTVAGQAGQGKAASSLCYACLLSASSHPRLGQAARKGIFLLPPQTRRDEYPHVWDERADGMMSTVLFPSESHKSPIDPSTLFGASLPVRSCNPSSRHTLRHTHNA